LKPFKVESTTHIEGLSMSSRPPQQIRRGGNGSRQLLEIVISTTAKMSAARQDLFIINIFASSISQIKKAPYVNMRRFSSQMYICLFS